MKTAIGLLMAVIGGVMIYDGFAGRSMWSDALAILRGQTPQRPTSGIPTTSGNPNAAPNPQLVGGGDTANTQPSYNVPLPHSVTSGDNNVNPIGRIANIRGGATGL